MRARTCNYTVCKYLLFSDLVEKFMIRKLWRNLFMTDEGTEEYMKILFPLIDKDGDGEVNKLEFT